MRSNVYFLAMNKITDQHYYFALEYDTAFETVHNTTMKKFRSEYVKKDEYVESIFQHIVDTHRRAIELYGFYHGDLIFYYLCAFKIVFILYTRYVINES